MLSEPHPETFSSVLVHRLRLPTSMKALWASIYKFMASRLIWLTTSKREPPNFANLPPEVLLNIMEQANSPLDIKTLCHTSPTLRALYFKYHKQIIESTLNRQLLHFEQDFEIIINIIWVKSKRRAVRHYRISEPYDTVLGPMQKLELRCKRYAEIEAIADIARDSSRHLQGYCYSGRLIPSRGKIPVRELYIRTLSGFVQIMLAAKRLVPDRECDCVEALQYVRLHFFLRAALMAFDVNQLLILANILTLVRRTVTHEGLPLYDKVEQELRHNEVFGMLCDDQCSRDWWTHRLLAYLWILISEDERRKLLFMGRHRDVAMATRAQAFDDVVSYQGAGTRKLYKLMRAYRMSVEDLWAHGSWQVMLANRPRGNAELEDGEEPLSMN